MIGESLTSQIEHHFVNGKSLDHQSTGDSAEGKIRLELVNRVIKNLIDDSIRCDGELKRADIDRSYMRRKFEVEECVFVEQALKLENIRIIEDNDDFNDDGKTDNRFIVSNKRRRFLTEDDERRLGRAIQLAKKIGTENDSNKSIFGQLYVNAQRAKTYFVESNIRYVWKLAKRLGQPRHITQDDLFQEGMVGLLKAADAFDPELGFRFKTYATWWINQHIRRALDDQNRTVRLPVHTGEKIRRVKRAEARLERETGRPPSIIELADELQIDPDRLKRLLFLVHATDCIDGDQIVGDDDSHSTLLSLVSDQNVSSQFDIRAYTELKQVILDLMDGLEERSKDVLKLRFGFVNDDAKTLEEVGQIYSVTRERIRQIEARAIAKLTKRSKKINLRIFLENESNPNG